MSDVGYTASELGWIGTMGSGEGAVPLAHSAGKTVHYKQDVGIILVTLETISLDVCWVPGQDFGVVVIRHTAIYESGS